jgi:deazaflavin-dependent oxidoreductase (nitroreductase family)
MLRISKIHTLLYRSTNGLIGARLDGLDMLLLTTTGRHSGKRRVTPMPYFQCDDRFVMIASNGNQKNNPAWYFNLMSACSAMVQIKSNIFTVEASVTPPGLREDLWSNIVKGQPRYIEYQSKTDRLIPLILLSRVAD